MIICVTELSSSVLSYAELESIIDRAGIHFSRTNGSQVQYRAIFPDGISVYIVVSVYSDAAALLARANSRKVS